MYHYASRVSIMDIGMSLAERIESWNRKQKCAKHSLVKMFRKSMKIVISVFTATGSVITIIIAPGLFLMFLFSIRASAWLAGIQNWNVKCYFIESNDGNAVPWWRYLRDSHWESVTKFNPKFCNNFIITNNLLISSKFLPIIFLKKYYY